MLKFSDRTGASTSRHSTGFWRPAPSAGRAPSWIDRTAGSSPTLQTSWSTRRARPPGAWCRGRRWYSWRWGTVREGWKRERAWRERMKGKEGKERKTERERTNPLLSLGINKRDLSSQSFAVCTEAMGDPGCVCVWNSPTYLRAHPQLCLLLCTMCVCLCVYISVCGSVEAFVHWEGLEFPWDVGCVGEHVSAGGQTLTQGQRGISAAWGMWRIRRF